MAFCSFFGGEKYRDHFKTGTYVCSKCDYELFPSTAKYEHSSPWPAFRHTVHADSLARREERPGVFKTSIRSLEGSKPVWEGRDQCLSCTDKLER